LSGVRLRFGRRWREEARRGALSPAVARDFIDLVVDAENLTARLREECIFPWLADVMEGALALCEGRARKVIVPFPEAPWELALHPMEGGRVGLSLYSVAVGGEVAALDRAMWRGELMGALRSAGRGLLRELGRAAPGLLEDPLVRRIEAAAEALAPWCVVAGSGPGRVAPVVWRTLRQPLGSSALVCEVDVGREALLEYRGEHAFDLHALLGRGSLWLEGPEGPVRLDEGYPLQGLRRLLREARALQRRERRSPGSLLRREGERLVVSAASRRWGRRHGLRALERADEAAEASLAVTEEALAEALSALVEALARQWTERNGALRGEARLRDLLAEARGLKARAAGPQAAGVAAEEEAQEVHPEGERSLEDEEAGFSWEALRRVVYRRRWSAPMEGPAELFVWGDAALIVDQEGARALCAETGGARWSQAGVEALSVRGEGLLASLEGGRVASLDPRSGVARWWREVEGGGASLSVARFGDEARRWWVLVGARGLEGISEEGARLWWRPWEHGVPLRAVCWGDQVVVALDDGALCAVEARGGALRWCAWPEAGAPRWLEAGPSQLLLGARTPGSAQSVVRSLDPRSGQARWEVPVEGAPLHRPRFFGEWVAWGFADRGAAGLQVVHAGSGVGRWSRRFLSAGFVGPSPLLLLEDEIEGGALCWKSDNGEVYAHDLITGRTRWRERLVAPEEALWSNLPLRLHAGALLAVGAEVCALDPRSGEALHRLEALPPHPTWLHVGPRRRLLVATDPAEVGESALECWEPEGFLALLRGGAGVLGGNAR
jgi:hypothetical protein